MNPVEQRISEISGAQAIEARQAPPPLPAPAKGAAAGSFNDILVKMVSDVHAMQRNATESLNNLESIKPAGPEDINVQMEQADRAYEIMMKIRHKLTDAYGHIAGQSPAPKGPKAG